MIDGRVVLPEDGIWEAKFENGVIDMRGNGEFRAGCIRVDVNILLEQYDEFFSQEVANIESTIFELIDIVCVYEARKGVKTIILNNSHQLNYAYLSVLSTDPDSGGATAYFTSNAIDPHIFDCELEIKVKAPQ